MIITMMLDLIKIRFWGGGSFSTGWNPASFIYGPESLSLTS
jgi:hypothetical protein